MCFYNYATFRQKLLPRANTINPLMFNVATKTPHQHFVNFSVIKLVAVIRQIDDPSEGAQQYFSL